MTTIYNFSAGPAMLPIAVMECAQREFRDWHGTGMSTMEMSHREKSYISIAEKAEADLRALLDVPQGYKVLFLQGGATLQFAMVPMNLLGAHESADYLDTGQWSLKAISEAKRFCKVNVVASAKANNYTTVPARASWQIDPNAAYLHYTPNETIGGVEFDSIPADIEVPLVGDFSSTILSRPLDVSRFGLIYAGAQKNIGPAGLTVVIVREDLLREPPAGSASLLDYRVHAAADSMANTPPTYAWYLAGLVFEWIAEQGGLQAMARANQEKAGALYAAIDDSPFYANPVDPPYRSWMNVPFTLADEALDADFLAGASAAGLKNLKGHRSVGGMRASIYNAMPKVGVDTLIEYMREFERTRG
ncbi:MAG: 3-phosphoserine/phosphohydroxythreonine transaminase [Chromatiales bacterium]|nr:3-phosphoserine/phosphohydroxythreonine transaminase [Chromatiales bacterium]